MIITDPAMLEPTIRLMVFISVILVLCLGALLMALILMLFKKIDYFAAAIACYVVSLIALGLLVFTFICQYKGLL